jgi:hypothetical protein
MSRCIDLFVDAPVPIDQLATELGAMAGVMFIGDPGGSTWLLRQDDATACLAAHDFDDDRNLPFSRYRYDLYSRVDSRNLLGTPEAALLRHVFGAVKGDGRYPAVLVFDLQHVIDKAEARAIEETAP